MRKLINFTFRQSLYIYIFYLIGHVITKVETKINPILTLLIIYIITFVANFIIYKYPNKTLSRFQSILFLGIFQFGIPLYITMIDFINVSILTSVVIYSIAGMLFGISMLFLSENSKNNYTSLKSFNRFLI